jgi:putative Holliday junction resolvase
MSVAAPGDGLRTVMGFDFGLTVIGVAIGQTLTRTATPLACLPARDGIPDWSQVERLIRDWEPDAFVVGIPLNMDGTPTALAPHARKLGNRLKERFRRPWYDADERLSTRAAWSELEARGKTRGGQRRVDDVAAALVLEGWLEKIQRDC